MGMFLHYQQTCSITNKIYIYILSVDFFAYLHVYICEYIPSLLKILSFLQCYVRFTIMFGQCMVMFCWCRLNWDFFFGL